MIRLLVFIILFFLAPGCNFDRGINKKYILDRDLMVNILIDIHLGNALQGSPEYYSISRTYDSIDTNSLIFLKHGVDKASFDSSIVYYTSKPEVLISIYDEVIMRLTQMQDSIKANEKIQ